MRRFSSVSASEPSSGWAPHQPSVSRLTPTPHAQVSRGIIGHEFQTCYSGGVGKSSNTSTWCTLGEWQGVYLDLNGARVPIELSSHSTVDFHVGTWFINAFGESPPHAVLQTLVELSPPPESILAACGISRDVSVEGERWAYVEATASDGAEAGYFGCATEHGLGACKQGHLTLAGVDSFKYAVARTYLLMIAGGLLICSFFAGVAGFVAYRAALAVVTNKRATSYD